MDTARQGGGRHGDCAQPAARIDRRVPEDDRARPPNRLRAESLLFGPASVGFTVGIDLVPVRPAARLPGITDAQRDRYCNGAGCVG